MDSRSRIRRGVSARVRVAVLLLAGVLSVVAAGRAREAAGPNVLLIVVDTLRRDHLGAYGYADRATTPRLDALAAQSIRFDRAYGAAPWTTPAIGALLTSQYPTTLGIKEHRSALPEEFPLLSQTLRRNGYATGAVVSHSLCSSRWHFDQGFDSFDESNILGHTGVSSASVTDRAIEFLSAKRRKPFFLWVHYFDPHYVYVEHPEFPFPAEQPYEGRVRSAQMFESVRMMQLDEGDIAEMVRLYDSEVAYTDAHIGRLLDHLRASGRYDDTLIIVTADHGEEFHDHGAIGHSQTLYDELIRVPLLLRIPGRGGAVVREEVATVDVYPTVLEVLGIESTGDLVGESLLDRDPRGKRPAFFETAQVDPARGVQYGRWKYIRHLESDRRELYDTIADPAERSDRCADEPALAAELGGLLDDWSARVSAGDDPAVELDLSADERERLRALGYVD